MSNPTVHSSEFFQLYRDCRTRFLDLFYLNENSRPIFETQLVFYFYFLKASAIFKTVFFFGAVNVKSRQTNNVRGHTKHRSHIHISPHWTIIFNLKWVVIENNTPIGIAKPLSFCINHARIANFITQFFVTYVCSAYGLSFKFWVIPNGSYCTAALFLSIASAVAVNPFFPSNSFSPRLLKMIKIEFHFYINFLKLRATTIFVF